MIQLKLSLLTIVRIVFDHHQVFIDVSSESWVVQFVVVGCLCLPIIGCLSEELHARERCSRKVFCTMEICSSELESNGIV